MAASPALGIGLISYFGARFVSGNSPTWLEVKCLLTGCQGPPETVRLEELDLKGCSKHAHCGCSRQSSGSARDCLQQLQEFPCARGAGRARGDPGRAGGRACRTPGPPRRTPRGSHLHPSSPTSPIVGGTARVATRTRGARPRHTHPWSACPAPLTSPSTSGTARASSRRPEETRRVSGRDPGAGAGRRLWRLANPASASLPQAPRNLRAPPCPPGADPRLAASRTPPATPPRPPHFVMGHSDSGSGVAGAGDRGWRALSGTAHARKGARACALAKHGLERSGCGLFSWRQGRSECPVVG